MFKKFIKKVGSKIKNYVNEWLKYVVDLFFSVSVGYRITWAIFCLIALIEPKIALAMVFYPFCVYLLIVVLGGRLASAISFFTPVRDIAVDAFSNDIKGADSKNT